MRLRWTPAAADDLEQISSYLHRHQPQWALPTIQRIYSEILGLRRFPSRGRPGTEPGTRELILYGLPYVIVFRAKGEAVEVLHIYHGAQNWQ